jgi:hypothetical protein
MRVAGANNGGQPGVTTQQGEDGNLRLCYAYLDRHLACYGLGPTLRRLAGMECESEK